MSSRITVSMRMHHAKQYDNQSIGNWNIFMFAWSPPGCLAVSLSTVAISDTLAVGCAAINYAATPATCGEAIDVPSM